MNQDRLSRHLLIAFLLSLALYVGAYWFIQSRRVADTPWVVTFHTIGNGQPEIEIRQESRQLGPVRVRIAAAHQTPSVEQQEVVFNEPKPVPFAVPMGQCIFQDTTFLPGTVVLEISGIRLQMLPRVLTIGTNEFPWTRNSLIEVPAAAVPETP